MVEVELCEAVAGAARVPDARGRRGDARVQRHVRRHRVAAIDRVGHRVRAEDHRHRGTGRGVDHRGVGACIFGTAAAVAVHVRVNACIQTKIRQVGPGPGQRREPGAHQHRVAGGVGDVGGDELVAVAGVGRGHRAGHAGGVGRHRVCHVPGLQVGERRPVGDDVLQGAHVGVVNGGLVDIRQHPARHRVPDLGPGVCRRAKAVLAGEVEIRRHARRARRHRLRLPGRRRGRARGGHDEARRHGRTRSQCHETAPAQHDRAPHRQPPGQRRRRQTRTRQDPDPAVCGRESSSRAFRRRQPMSIPRDGQPPPAPNGRRDDAP